MGKKWLILKFKIFQKISILNLISDCYLKLMIFFHCPFDGCLGVVIATPGPPGHAVADVPVKHALGSGPCVIGPIQNLKNEIFVVAQLRYN